METDVTAAVTDNPPHVKMTDFSESKQMYTLNTKTCS